MSPDEPAPGLFWIACGLVLVVALFVLAKPLLGVRGRRTPTGWLVLLGSLIPASAVTAPVQMATISGPGGHYGWSSIHCPIDHKPDTSRHLLQDV